MGHPRVPGTRSMQAVRGAERQLGSAGEAERSATRRRRRVLLDGHSVQQRVARAAHPELTAEDLRAVEAKRRVRHVEARGAGVQQHTAARILRVVALHRDGFEDGVHSHRGWDIKESRVRNFD